MPTILAKQMEFILSTGLNANLMETPPQICSEIIFTQIPRTIVTPGNSSKLTHKIKYLIMMIHCHKGNLIDIHRDEFNLGIFLCNI